MHGRLPIPDRLIGCAAEASDCASRSWFEGTVVVVGILAIGMYESTLDAALPLATGSRNTKRCLRRLSRRHGSAAPRILGVERATHPRSCAACMIIIAGRAVSPDDAHILPMGATPGVGTRW